MMNPDQSKAADDEREKSSYSSNNTARCGDVSIQIDSEGFGYSRATTYVESPTIAEKQPSRISLRSWLTSSSWSLWPRTWKLPNWSKNLVRSSDTDLPIRTVESYPFGYPRVAAFQASEGAFSVYRSFGYLHSRVLLDLQYEISTLELELEQKDRDDADDADTKRRVISRKIDDKLAERNGEERSRRHILTDIRKKLVEYDEVLIKARETATFQRPTKRDSQSVRNFLDNVKPIAPKEREFLLCEGDTVTLRQGREWAGFDAWVESMLRRLNWAPLKWIFQPRRLTSQTCDEDIHYYDGKRVETLVALIITVIIFVLLVLPVFAMYRLTSFGDRSSTFDAIGVLVVFTLLFSAAMSLLTQAKRHELFGASAAYCAVLVVFISNFGGPDGAQLG